MEYIKEEQILLDETLCSEHATETDKLIYAATKRFKENIRLVNHIASKYSYVTYNSTNTLYDMDDVLQEGYTGLWKACLNFNPGLGFEFSTYAVPFIRGYIMRMLRDNSVNVHVPRWFKDIRYTLYKHGYELPLSKDEIDTLLAEGEFTYEQLMTYTGVSVTSIDSPLRLEDGDVTLGDTIKDPSLSVQDRYTEDELEDIITDIVKLIPENYRDIAEEWLYSIVADDPLTQLELAKKYGYSQAQIARIKKKVTTAVNQNGKLVYKLFGI